MMCPRRATGMSTVPTKNPALRPDRFEIQAGHDEAEIHVEARTVGRANQGAVRDDAFREKAVAGSIEWFPPAPKLEPHRLAHPPTPRGLRRGRGGGGGRGLWLRTAWRRIARSNWPPRGRSARIVRPPARATGRGARMRPFGSTHADRSGIVSSPAGDRALDPGLVRPGLVLGQGLEPLDGLPVGLSDLDRAGVPRPGRSSPGGPHPPGECPVRRSSARMPTGLLKPPVGFAQRPLAPPGVRSAESSTTRALPGAPRMCLFIFVTDR